MPFAKVTLTHSYQEGIFNIVAIKLELKFTKF